MHYNANNSYLRVNEKEIFKFKADNENVIFPISFVLEIYLMYLMDLEPMSLEKYLLISLKMCMIFCSITILLINLVVLKIHKCLMIKNNIK